MKIYMIKLHYENRDEYEIIDEERFAESFETALRIFAEMKDYEIKNTWLANVDFNKLDFYCDLPENFTADDLGNSNLYTEISIKQVEVE